MTAAILILAGAAFLAVAAFAVFAVLVLSIHRTDRVRMSEAGGGRRGAIARRVLAGIGTRAGKGGDE